MLNKAEDNAAEMNAAGEAGKGIESGSGAGNEAPNAATDSQAGNNQPVVVHVSELSRV
jgi:hypothetical protein